MFALYNVYIRYKRKGDANMKRKIVNIVSIVILVVLISATCLYLSSCSQNVVNLSWNFGNVNEMWEYAFKNTSNLDEYTINYSFKNVHNSASGGIQKVTESSTVKVVYDYYNLNLYYKLNYKITTRYTNGKSQTNKYIKETYVEQDGSTLCIYQYSKENEKINAWEKTEIQCNTMNEMSTIFILYYLGEHELSYNEHQIGKIAKVLTDMVNYNIDGLYISNRGEGSWNYLNPFDYHINVDSREFVIKFKDNKVKAMTVKTTPSNVNDSKSTEKWTLSFNANANIPYAARKLR